MTIWTKLSIRAGIAALIATTSVILTLVVVAVRPKPSVPLTANLSGEWANVSREFDRRIRDRFSVGSSETAMTQELQRQGFVRNDWKYAISDAQEAAAIRSGNNLVCNQAAFVYWRADIAGHITAVRGEYRELGCL